MNDERLWILINQQLDGSNSVQQEQELQLELEKHPRARRLMSEARAMWQQLDGLDGLDVDPAFGPEIRKRLRVSDPPQPGQGGLSHPVRPARGGWGLMWVPLAAGVLVGFALGLLSHEETTGVEMGHLFATMGSAGDWSASSPQTIPGGTIQVSHSGDSYLMDVSMEGADPLEIEFGFDERLIGMSGLTSSVPCTLNAEQGRIRLIPPSGSISHRLLWVQRVDAEVSVSVSIFRDSRLLGEKAVKLRRP